MNQFFLPIAVLLAASILYLRRCRRSSVHLPPGPPGGWRYGSYLPVDTRQRVKVLKEWVSRFGPVIMVKQEFGKSIILLCDYKSSTSILDKEGAVTSDRPRFVAVGELLCGGLCLSLMRTVLEDIVRGFHTGLQTKAIPNYEPILETYSKLFIKDVLNDPHSHLDHSWKWAANSVIHVTYGYSSLFSDNFDSHAREPPEYLIPSYTTPNGSSYAAIIRHIQVVSSRFVDSLRPRTFMADTFPILAKLPSWMYHTKAVLVRWRKEESLLYTGLMEGVKRARDLNSGPFGTTHEDMTRSFCSRLLSRQKEIDLTDDQVAHVAGGLFGAGTHTTSSALSWVIMAAALHPKAQELVQQQIDSVVGDERSPFASDEACLPLVTAFYLETYRWRPVTNEGFPHRFTKDVTWNGYLIPKGSIVYGHHWMISRSIEDFSDPDAFDPMRWICYDADGSMKIRTDVKTVSFGFGRRICPGMHLANKALFIATASMLWAFDLSEDPSQPIDDMNFGPGVNIRPRPFYPMFKPRRSPELLEKVLFA